MWEITLIGEVQDYSHFHIFENMIKSNYGNNVIVAISLNCSGSKLSIAVKTKKLIYSILKKLD